MTSTTSTTSTTSPAATTPPSDAARTPWTGTATRDEVDHWLAVVEPVAVRLGEQALQRDRDNASPRAALDELRDAGLANLVVPAEHGGVGAHWETAFQVLRRVSRADAAVGQVLGYHYLNQACIGFYGTDPAVRDRWFRHTAAGHLFWSDSFNPVSPDLHLVADGDAYRLSGTKRFATGAAAADLVVAGAVADGGALDGRFVVFAVGTDRAGVEHLGDWDHLGQRATASGSVRYTDVLVTPDDVIGFDDGAPFSTLVTPGVQLLFGNIYLAAAQGALERARDLTLARRNAWFLSSVDRYAQDPHVHRLLGELVARTQAVEALADALGRRFDEVVALGPATTAADRGEIEVAVAGLKVVSTEVALDVTARVYEATGASSTASSVGLDLYWRNVRTHTLHDPVDYKKAEVGAHFLDGTLQPVSLYT